MSHQGKAPPNDISALEHYHLVRQQIEHEDDLVGQRISWFTAAQSFFFSAYAIVTSNLHAETATTWIGRQQHGLFKMIPIIALANCLISWLTVAAGMKAMRQLRDGYEAWLKEAGKSTPRGIPDVQGKRVTRAFGQAGPRLLPAVFLIVWVILLFRGLER